MRILKTAFITMSVLMVAACAPKNEIAPAITPDKEVEAKVESVLKKMSLKEKAGQMVQLSIDTITDENTKEIDPAKLDRIIGEYKVGSILNLLNDVSRSREGTAAFVRQIQEKSMEAIGIPCIYGLDMIHGANYLTDGSLYPQEINMGATFNREYPKMMGEALAYETRAAQVAWVFSPVMDLGRDPRWPRHWESWGEDPYLQAEMARTETMAIQGDDPNHVDLEHAAVSIKHFMGYGVPATGKDRTPAYIAENDLREKFFRPFKECFQAGALTTMINSASINGVPTHANKTLLTGWVKDDLNWDGMIVTDWADIDNLFNRDHVAADKREAVAMGINAGIDMIMDPYDPECVNVIVDLAESGEIPMERIDDAVRRILRLKVRLGLFENPSWEYDYKDFGCEKFARESYAAALESEVLLKNEGNILPLDDGIENNVIGELARTVRFQGGGSSHINAVKHPNILEELKKAGFKVNFAPGYLTDTDREDATLKEEALKLLRNKKVTIFCGGLTDYAEGEGYDRKTLDLPRNQVKLFEEIKDEDVVFVSFGGSAFTVPFIDKVKAMLHMHLGGEAVSEALVRLLKGEVNPSGRLADTFAGT